MRTRAPARRHVPVLAFAIALLAGPALAGAIDGTVRDARTGDALDGVRLELADTPHQASSSREGSFSLADVPLGRHRLRATLAGYRRAEVEWLWAAKQDRLASGDRADHRIAPGGTPGWDVLNLRDEAYRTHGSGIDGVGRAVWASVEASF